MVKRKKKKKSSPLIYIGIVALLGISILLVVFNLNIWKHRQESGEHVARVKSEFDRLSQEREKLEKEALLQDVEEEIERIAREDLLLRKEGESVILISREEDEEEEGEVIEEVEEEESLWEKIKDIFK